MRKSLYLFAAILLGLLYWGGAGGCGGGSGATGGGGAPTALLGVWCAPFTDPTFGNATDELILKTDAIQFQEQYVYQAGSVISIYGNFRFFTDPNGQQTLRLDTAGGEPVVDQAGNPIHYPAETYCFTGVDTNHMILDVGFINCPGGPETCFVQCSGCDPRVQVCELRFTKSSCSGAPGLTEEE